MFVKYIQQETGTRVQIKGLGSGFVDQETGRESDEPMHIHITYAFSSFLNAQILTLSQRSRRKHDCSRQAPRRRLARSSTRRTCESHATSPSAADGAASRPDAVRRLHCRHECMYPSLIPVLQAIFPLEHSLLTPVGFGLGVYSLLTLLTTRVDTHLNLPAQPRRHLRANSRLLRRMAVHSSNRLPLRCQQTWMRTLHTGTFSSDAFCLTCADVSL